MHNYFKTTSITILTIALAGCGGSSPPEQPSIQVNVDFNLAPTGWVGGFSDYTNPPSIPAGTNPNPGIPANPSDSNIITPAFGGSTKPVDVVTEFRTLPIPFSGRGFYLFGTNKSDDLFLYAKKKITGFSPNKEYALSYRLTFLTNASSGCAGVGGSPGESVYVKVAASTIEPLTVQVGDNFQMNIDKGAQANAGKNSLVLGNMANSSTDCSNAVYKEKKLTSETVLKVVADASGAIWLLLGIDSGFEAASNIYYESLVVTAMPTGH